MRCGQTNDANVIDEELVIEALENAPDYEKGLARLDDMYKQKGLVARLKSMERASRVISRILTDLGVSSLNPYFFGLTKGHGLREIRLWV